VTRGEGTQRPPLTAGHRGGDADLGGVCVLWAGAHGACRRPQSRLQGGGRWT